VLVVGGAGSVAHYAIQFAKLRGAVVLTTVSNEAKAAHAKTAGADATINYRGEDLAERVKALTEGRGVNAVVELDLTRNAKLYPAIVRPHGRVVVYGMSGPEATLPALWMMQNTVALLPFLIYEISAEDRAAGLAEVGRLLEAGKLRHTVAQELPLERIADAHDIVERGETMGNVVLDI
jgi:NADPH2:quinone reductase